MSSNKRSPGSALLLAMPAALLAASCRSAPPATSPTPETAEVRTGDAAMPTAGTEAPEAPATPHTAGAAAGAVGTDPGGVGSKTPLKPREGDELGAFAAGCFWGVEDAFRHVPGVVATAVGFTGGHTVDPTYEAVCTHTTGHAETVLVEFDPKRVSYEKLVRVFFRIHDPTTLNRQGPDVGDQYRSAIFTFSDAQVRTARAALAEAQRGLGTRIVTEIRPIGRFYLAEAYHQQYAERTGFHGCPTGLVEGI